MYDTTMTHHTRMNRTLATVVTATKAVMIESDTYISGIEVSRAAQVTSSAGPGTLRAVRARKARGACPAHDSPYSILDVE